MIIRELNKDWTMHQSGMEECFPASVPGSVYYDLIQNGRMEDPYYRDNELKSLKIMDHDLVYETRFGVEEELLDCDKILLVFDGIDTLADIYLNGEKIAFVNNMHRTWEFPVTDILKASENTLKVILHSPTKFIKEENSKDPIPATTDAMEGFPYLRKAHCMFGWDWGPRLPDAGIWRAVKLVGFCDARIDDVYIRQVHTDESVKLLFEVDAERIGQEHVRRFSGDEKRLEGLYTEVIITEPSGEKCVYSHQL